MVGYAKCGTESTSENAGDGRVGGLSLPQRLGPSSINKRDSYRSCHHCPVFTPDLHPSIFLRCLFFALRGVIKGLGVRFGRNITEERQKLVLKRVKVKAQELFRVFLMPTLRCKLSQMVFPGHCAYYSLSCYQIASWPSSRHIR